MMELKAGYKQTEVGVIPSDWETKTIEEIAEVKSGKRLPLGKSLIDSETYHPYIRVTDMYFGGVTINNIKFVPVEVFPLIKNYRIYVDDIFISVAGSLGIVGRIPEALDGANLTENANRLTNISCDIDFLLNILMSSSIQNKIDAEKTLGAQPKLALTRIRNFYIPLPPTKTEQTAIAAVLNDTDQLITQLEQLIAKKRNIKQGAMQALLKPKAGWEEKSLLALAENKKELFDDGDWVEAEHITNQGIRLIQTGNIGIGKYVEKDSKKYIFEKSYEQLKCKPLFEGDLLICRLAEPAGRACVLPNIGENKVITSVDVTIFRPHERVANRLFLANLFSTSKWFQLVNERVGGTTHKRISRSALGNIMIHVPSIEEQDRIAQILTDMDTELEALAQKLAKYRMLKQGMMQTLLTGKTRLVKPNSN